MQARSEGAPRGPDRLIQHDGKDACPAPWVAPGTALVPYASMSAGEDTSAAEPPQDGAEDALRKRIGVNLKRVRMLIESSARNPAVQGGEG